jgi:hypothetical protein
VGQHSASASRLLGLDGFKGLVAQVAGNEWHSPSRRRPPWWVVWVAGSGPELHGRRTVRIRDLPVGGRPVGSAPGPRLARGRC